MLRVFDGFWPTFAIWGVKKKEKKNPNWKKHPNGKEKL